MFDGVEWSCARTLSTQVAALCRVGLGVVEGRRQGDVDEVHDLLKLLHSVTAHRQAQGQGAGGAGLLPSFEALVDVLEEALAALPPT